MDIEGSAALDIDGENIVVAVATSQRRTFSKISENTLEEKQIETRHTRVSILTKIYLNIKRRNSFSQDLFHSSTTEVVNHVQLK